MRENSKRHRASHELMTPLNHILGMAQLIQIELDEEKRREYFATLMEAGTELESKINVFLCELSD